MQYALRSCLDVDVIAFVSPLCELFDQSYHVAVVHLIGEIVELKLENSAWVFVFGEL